MQLKQYNRLVEDSRAHSSGPYQPLAAPWYKHSQSFFDSRKSASPPRKHRVSLQSCRFQRSTKSTRMKAKANSTSPVPELLKKCEESKTRKAKNINFFSSEATLPSRVQKPSVLGRPRFLSKKSQKLSTRTAWLW